MKITNETHYSSRDLRRFFSAGLRALGVQGPMLKAKRIRVSYSRRSMHWGCATIATGFQARTWMMFTVPKDPAKLDLGQLGKVLRHENAHNLGLQHGEMEYDLRYCTGPAPDWIAGLSIGVKVPTSKPKPSREDVVEARAVHAEAKVLEWKRRTEAAGRRLISWRRKATRYRRLAAAARPPVQS